MALLTDEQRALIVSCKAGLVALQAVGSDAADLIIELERIDRSELMDGNVNIDSIWSDAVQSWLALRLVAIAAAQALPTA